MFISRYKNDIKEKIRMTKTKQHEKTRDMLAKIIETRPGDVYTLMALSYLIDVVAKEKLGTTISDFCYANYSFGPFDKSIYSKLEHLVKDEVICSKSEYCAYGKTVVYMLNPEKEEEVKVNNLKDNELDIIMSVVEDCCGYGSRLIADIVRRSITDNGFLGR